MTGRKKPQTLKPRLCLICVRLDFMGSDSETDLGVGRLSRVLLGSSPMAERRGEDGKGGVAL